MNLFYLGESTKNKIFRATKWNIEKDAKIFRKIVYNENYDTIGIIKEIFGPLKLPFVSIRTRPEIEFNPKSTLYVKI
ncbi:MAG TPA: hypothetical protein VGB37_07460 [Candidatus Lokiarchaeia archaeon]